MYFLFSATAILSDWVEFDTTETSELSTAVARRLKQALLNVVHGMQSTFAKTYNIGNRVGLELLKKGMGPPWDACFRFGANSPFGEIKL